MQATQKVQVDPTDNQAKWRREGDSIYMKYEVVLTNANDNKFYLYPGWCIFEFIKLNFSPKNPFIQKVIWIANKHLHNYNLQNNPQYQVKCHRVDDDGQSDDNPDSGCYDDIDVGDNV